MTAQVSVGETDDPTFIALLNSIRQSVTHSIAPEQLWVIQIDNWFDDKWLCFSGIGIVDFPLPAHGIGEHGALEEFRQEKLTFPPFTPNRVLGQWSYTRQGDSYTERQLIKLPHSSKRQPSERNLQRRVEEFNDSSVFIWYSSNTVANDRGSVMVYAVDRKTEAWFASFVRKSDWALHATKGVSREEVQRLLDGRSWAADSP